MSEKAIIITKVGPLFGSEHVDGRTCDLRAKHIAERCDLSLKRLQTDYIDLYLAHWPDPLTPIEETMEAVNKLHADGKIRWFGVSNFANDLLRGALDHGQVAANELPYSLADRSIDAERRPFCLQEQVGIIAYSPLGKGVLSGKYDAQRLPAGGRLSAPEEILRKGEPASLPGARPALARAGAAILLHSRPAGSRLGNRETRNNRCPSGR